VIAMVETVTALPGVAAPARATSLKLAKVHRFASRRGLEIGVRSDADATLPLRPGEVSHESSIGAPPEPGDGC
jgi:hypothetical protein